MSVSHKLDGIYAIFRFEGPLLLALHRFKHRIAHFLASSLAQLMADRVSQLRANSVPVPVPLHSMRLLESGDNQSELFAVELASMYNLDIQISTLQRVLNTALQARLTDAAKRIINLSGAFKMAGRHLNDRRVIIVDNVCTTRTNLDSCAVALKKGVAQIVHAPVLAHEVSIGIF
jgi:predicted amidophosphoribosyltransferase